MTWLVFCGTHYLQGPTAADKVHPTEVNRRAPVARLRCAPVPVRRRQVVRRPVTSLVEADPEVIHRIRQPGLGTGAYTRPLFSST